MPAMLARRAPNESRFRSSLLPLGSPIMPVAPPITAMGRCPACWNRRKIIRAIKCPTCRLSAVGSKPA